MTRFCIQPPARGGSPSRVCHWLLAVFMVSALAGGAAADTVTFSGNITQSTQDGTGPAVNNPDLNNIQDLQDYTVTLAFAGSITAPGFYDLTGSSLMFSVPAAPATESSFGSISLTITANGSFDDLSLLGCLTTGSDCLVGNQLSGNFRIPAALLNAQNVPAIGLDQPHPLDLLEDDGTTDIHGSITTYSYTGSTSAVPEPSSVVLLIFALPALSLIKKQLHNRRKRI